MNVSTERALCSQALREVAYSMFSYGDHGRSTARPNFAGSQAVRQGNPESKNIYYSSSSGQCGRVIGEHSGRRISATSIVDERLVCAFSARRRDRSDAWLPQLVDIMARSISKDISHRRLSRVALLLSIIIHKINFSTMGVLLV